MGTSSEKTREVIVHDFATRPGSPRLCQKFMLLPIASADSWRNVEREVRKATRDMTNLLAGIANPLERMDALQKRNTDLFAEMKRLERDHVKTKKRADQLQKEKDASRSELSKNVSLRERLEKLCRELTRENKKMKVRYLEDTALAAENLIGSDDLALG
jgi:predicted RNase H-like nuclease (RuvC/YqgF family)